MKDYLVVTKWEGYSRGHATYSISADSPEEARELYYDGDEIDRSVVRDDTEEEVESVKEVV